MNKNFTIYLAYFIFKTKGINHLAQLLQDSKTNKKWWIALVETGPHSFALDFMWLECWLRSRGAFAPLNDP